MPRHRHDAHRRHLRNFRMAHVVNVPDVAPVFHKLLKRHFHGVLLVGVGALGFQFFGGGGGFNGIFSDILSPLWDYSLYASLGKPYLFRNSLFGYPRRRQPPDKLVPVFFSSAAEVDLMVGEYKFFIFPWFTI